MLTNIAITQIYVLDQDEALDFYVGKLGMEIHTDIDLGFMRWLTVNVPGAKDREILLEKPGNPMQSAETIEAYCSGCCKPAGTLSMNTSLMPAAETFL